MQFDGVLAEHHAVRHHAGVFDVSHLGRFSVEGPGATDLVRHQLCNDITKIEPGRAQYTMALNERGGVEDDIIVWRFGDESYWVLPNGANQDEIVARFTAAAPDGVAVTPLQTETALLAVQGPESPAILDKVLGVVPRRFRVEFGEIEDAQVWMAGTGYTGERGAEVCVPADAGPALLERLLEAGAVPCGLGARDTLRLEKGYPLWGQDLDAATTPLEAGLGWVVDWEHDFVGREALHRQLDGPLPKQLVAFQVEGRGIPRHGYPLRAGGARGEVTSGNFSPVLDRGIGMGFVAPPDAIGEPAEFEVRGRTVPVVIVDLPFVD